MRACLLFLKFLSLLIHITILSPLHRHSFAQLHNAYTGNTGFGAAKTLDHQIQDLLAGVAKVPQRCSLQCLFSHSTPPQVTVQSHQQSRPQVVFMFLQVKKRGGGRRMKEKKEQKTVHSSSLFAFFRCNELFSAPITSQTIMPGRFYLCCQTSGGHGRHC